MNSDSPQIESITSLQRDQLRTMENLAEGPIFLTQRNQHAAVLLDPEHWNSVVEYIEYLEDALAAYKAKYEIAIG